MTLCVPENNTWFISDTHFGHTNVIKYSNRPYATVQEMDESIILNWQQNVRPNDYIFHLGDMGMLDTDRLRKIIMRLPGQKYWIKGNHDKRTKFNQVRDLFVGIYDYLEIDVSDKNIINSDPHRASNKQRIILFHYSCRVWNRSHFGSWQLYGHSHGSLEDSKNLLSMDVGVDATKLYGPISYRSVKKHISTKQWTPIDHHGDDGEFR